ncbi:MAG: hypothetical protein IJW29_07805 [Clostridia bacterium]|nr:hypothetical protein [Clostridia bacterium]
MRRICAAVAALLLTLTLASCILDPERAADTTAPEGDTVTQPPEDGFPNDPEDEGTKRY